MKMRLGRRERYELRGSRTVLREAGVKLPGRLTSYQLIDAKGYKIRGNVEILNL